MIEDDFKYNIAESEFNSRLAALAFCAAEPINKWNCALCETINMTEQSHISDNKTLTAGFIGYLPESKTIVTSWRGSSNKKNWEEDFNFELMKYPKCKDCKIHAGFYLDSMLLLKRVITKINAIMLSH